MFKKILLKWREPQYAANTYYEELSFFQKLWKKNIASFTTGFFLVPIGIMVNTGLPASVDEILFFLTFGILSGTAISIIYAIAALIKPKIIFTERYIERSYKDNIENWKYSDISSFRIYPKMIKDYPIRILELTIKNNDIKSIEISDEITNDMISVILLKKTK